MNKLLFLFLIPLSIFAQYGAPINSDPHFDSGIAGWTAGAIDPYYYTVDDSSIGRTNLLHGQVASTGVNRRVQYTVSQTLPIGTYTVIYSYYIPSNNTGTDDFAFLANGASSLFYNIQSESENVWHRFATDGDLDGTAMTTLNTYGWTAGANNAIVGDAIYLDDFYFCPKVDTLWTYTTGADTDNDTTATLKEALWYRGAHSGGHFITGSGTYSETFEIGQASFSKWEAVGGNVNITAVDFNSLTIDSLDAQIAKNITTPTEYSNVNVYFDNTLTTQATNLVLSDVTSSSMTLTWDRGDGDSVIVVMKAGSEPTAPTNDTNYTDNSIFGSGSEIGTAGYVVYTGTDNTIIVTGLASSTTYYIDIYEFDQALADWEYLASPLTGTQLSAAIETQDKGFKEYNKRITRKTRKIR